MHRWSAGRYTEITHNIESSSAKTELLIFIHTGKIYITRPNGRGQHHAVPVEYVHGKYSPKFTTGGHDYEKKRHLPSVADTKIIRYSKPGFVQDCHRIRLWTFWIVASGHYSGVKTEQGFLIGAS